MYENFNICSMKTFTGTATGNNFEKVKVRNSGVDFTRIASMYSIIVHHILGHGNAMRKFSKYRELKLMNIISFWHVSAYALISGYIGYKSNKYSNLLYLWFWTIFYTSSISFYLNRFRPEFKTGNINYTNFFPVIFECYWYFTKYFGMYLFLQVINKGLVYLTKFELRNVFLGLIFVYIIERDIMNPRGDPFMMGNGYSSIWLLIGFIMGVYFGKFKHNYHGFKKIIFYILYLIIFYYSAYFCYNISFYKIQNVNGYYKAKLVIYKMYQMNLNNLNKLK